MDPRRVELLVQQIRQTLQLQHAAEQQDLPEEERDAQLSEFLRKHAEAERARFVRETRADVKFQHNLDYQSTQAERLVEQKLKQEIQEDKIINDLEQTIIVLEKQLTANAKQRLQCSREILTALEQQEAALNAYLRTITDPNARTQALNHLLKLEQGKKKVLARKLELLREELLSRNRVEHDRKLITQLEQKKLQTARQLHQALEQEEGDAAAEEIRQDEHELQAT